MLHTSLSLIRAHEPCSRVQFVESWLGTRPETGLFPLTDLLSIQGLDNPDDTIWALRAVPPEEAQRRDRLARLYACDCAQRALERERTQGREPDPRSWKAIEVSRKFACGEATKAELDAARDAAWAAAWDAAFAAERAWQTEALRRALTVEEPGTPGGGEG